MMKLKILTNHPLNIGTRYIPTDCVINNKFSLQIGAKYEGENEKDLKDQMDFPQQPNCPAQLS